MRLLLGNELAESLEVRSEHAPENEIYDNFTRPVKGEIAAHFMRMCMVAGAFADENEQDEENPADEYLLRKIII